MRRRDLADQVDRVDSLVGWLLLRVKQERGGVLGTTSGVWAGVLIKREVKVAGIRVQEI